MGAEEVGKARESGVDDVCEDGDESEEGKGVEGWEEVVGEGVEGQVGCYIVISIISILAFRNVVEWSAW